MPNPQLFPSTRVRVWTGVNACALVVSLFIPIFRPEWTLDGFIPATLFDVGGVLFLQIDRILYYWYRPDQFVPALATIVGLGAMVVLFCMQIKFVLQPEEAGSTLLRWFVLIGGSVALAVMIGEVRLQLQLTILVLVCTLCSCGLSNLWIDRQDKHAL